MSGGSEARIPADVLDELRRTKQELAVRQEERDQLAATLEEAIAHHEQVDAELLTYKSMMDQVQKLGIVGGWEFDIDTMHQRWTEEVYTIHEVGPDYDPNVEDGIAFYAPSSRPIISLAVKNAMEHGTPYDLELEIVTAKGHLRNVHAIGRADLDQRKIYGFFQDITESKRMMKQTEETKANLDAIFEFSPVAMLILDDSTNILMANAAALVLCGGDRSEVLNRRPGDALHCAHSLDDPRDCGHSPTCPLCPARNAIEALLAEGGRVHGAEVEFTLSGYLLY